MIIFLKTLRHLISLNLSSSKFRPLRNKNYMCSMLITRKSTLCSVAAHEYFPLHQLKDPEFNHPNCDNEKWTQIVIEIMKGEANGRPMPTVLNMSDIEVLLDCKTQSQRYKYMKYLYGKEKKKIIDKEKKRLKLEQSIKIEYTCNTEHIDYRYGKNSLFLPFRKPAMRNFYKKKLANAAIYGQKMVFDLSYDEFMWKRERRDCAAQLRLVHSINRRHCDPFDLYFCNAKETSKSVEELHKEIPNISESLITFSENSYLDIFPKENLVYLSPHASETLTTYDHNAIYIIGAFVDATIRDPVSLHKSQDEGIKSYSLPIDKYVSWGSGTRSLTINQVFSIMLTMRDTGDWKEAFKHLPTRKLKEIEVNSVSTENELPSKKLCLIRN